MKKILILLLLIPFISKAQVPVEKYIPHAFYQTVSYPNLSASLPLKLNAAKQVTAAKILIGEVDTTVGVGIIGWPRMAKLRDSLAALITGGGGTPGGSSGNIQWNSSGSFAGFGTTNGTYLNIPGGVAASSTRNYPTGVSMGISVSGGEGYLDAYNGPGTGYVGMNINANPLKIFFNLSEVARFNANGLGIGLASASPWLHIAAGGVTRAPIMLTSGTDLSSAAAGAFEFDGTRLAFSPSTTRRRVLLINDVASSGGQIPIANVSGDYTVGNITSPNSTITVTHVNPNITVDIPTTVLQSAEYTPTMTDGANVTGVTILAAHYYRDKDFIIVYGLANAPCAVTATLSVFEVELPVASAMTSSVQLNGTGSVVPSPIITTINPAFCIGNPTTDQAIVRFYSTGTGDNNVSFNFSYKIR